MINKQRLATLRTTLYLLLACVLLLVGDLAFVRPTQAEGPRDERSGGEVVVQTPEPQDTPTEEAVTPDPTAEPDAEDVTPLESPTETPSRSRFGVAVNAQNNPLDYYADFGDLQATWYQNWSGIAWNRSYIDGVQFYPTIGAWNYLEGKETEAKIREYISWCPECYPDGTVWIIGNELQIDKFSWLREGVALDPARTITPEEYAVKYKKYYDIIKGINLTYKVAIGVTYDKPPYWSDFLRETRAAYETLYGEKMPIDVYTMHAYMSDPPLKEVQLLVDNKRTIMKEYGDQNKPLIMTETGALTDAAHNPGFTTEQISDYMNQVFEYLATYTSEEYGCPDDDYRMVQKWAWFALTSAAGSDADYWDKTDLFDTGGVTATITTVGETYAAFVKGDSLVPPWWPWGYVLKDGANVSSGTSVTAWIDNVRVGQTTSIMYDGESVYTLDVFADDPDTAWRDGGTDGDTVRFKVGSTWAAETGTWQWGTSSPITLTIPAYATSTSASTTWSTQFKNLGPQNRFPRIGGDVNGDGKWDMVSFDPGRGVFVGLSNGSSFAKVAQWSTEFQWVGDTANHRVLGDVNGDGKADVVGFKPGEGVYVALSTGTSFAAASLWSTAFQTYTTQKNYPRMVGDVNGDGKDDIVAFVRSEGVYVGLSNGTTFETPTLWSSEFGWNNDDFDHRLLADVNGDGKLDVVGYKYGEGVYVGLSTGTSFSAASLWSSQYKYWAPQNRFPRLAADMNGDGLADLVGFDPGVGRGAFVALSTGSSFSKAAQWTAEFNWLGDVYKHRELGDVNGDGRADIVGFYYGTGVLVGLSN